MATTSQREAAKRNLDQSPDRWRLSGNKAQPGSKGEGDYFRIVVRSKREFRTFRYQDVGRPGHIQRLAGKRASGTWGTQAWLISKGDAHVEDDQLVPDSKDAKEVLNNLASEPKHVKADIFEARDMVK